MILGMMGFISAYISFDGYGLAILQLFLFAVGHLLLCLIAAFLLIKRRWIAATIPIVLFLGSAFGPNLYGEWQSKRYRKMIADLSYWPDNIDIKGKTIAFLSMQRFNTCNKTCEIMIENSDVEAVYILDHHDVDVTQGFNLLPATIWRMAPDPNANTDEVSYHLTRTKPPSSYDYLFVADEDGSFTKLFASSLGIPKNIENKADKSLYIYHLKGNTSVYFEEAKPIAQMLGVNVNTYTQFFWIINNQSYVAQTTKYNQTLRRWLCGYETNEYTGACLYIF